jgi:ribosome-associated heat shock protein Hsp15
MRQRTIDKWLWFARCYKTRSLAASIVEAGEVRVNEIVVTKPSHPLREGDVLDIPTPTGKRRRRVQVLQLAERRKGAPEAQTLYRELVPADCP